MTAERRGDFPLLSGRMENGYPLVYLDNAATSQRPRQVIEAVDAYLERLNANPHRGAYALSADATACYEGVREKVARFIGAASPEKIVFTSGTTASVNMVAQSYGMEIVKPGDEILISIAEHHSNLLPWQRLAAKTGARLRYLYTDAEGKLSMKELAAKLSPRTKIAAITHISNVLGSINPIREIGEMVHSAGGILLVDAAQSAPHIRLDVQDLGADFLAFSGHKMLGPQGVGVLYGRKELLENMEPFLLGGGIVEEVTEQSVRFLETPWKFEAGTPNVEGVVGLGTAIDYLEGMGFAEMHRAERELTRYALERMKEIPGLELYGSKDALDRAGIISFNLEGVHPHDTASILDAYGIAIRAGHHCAQPLMKHLGVNATCRMSLYFYNGMDDVDRFVEALPKVKEVLGYGIA